MNWQNAKGMPRWSRRILTKTVPKSLKTRVTSPSRALSDSSWERLSSICQYKDSENYHGERHTWLQRCKLWGGKCPGHRRQLVRPESWRAHVLGRQMLMRLKTHPSRSPCPCLWVYLPRRHRRHHNSPSGIRCCAEGLALVVSSNQTCSVLTWTDHPYRLNLN